MARLLYVNAAIHCVMFTSVEVTILPQNTDSGTARLTSVTRSVAVFAIRQSGLYPVPLADVII